MPERTWQNPARYGQGSGRAVTRVPRAGAATAGRRLAVPFRVTGRGAVLGLFLLSFLGLLVSDWLAFGMAGGVTFVAACAAAAWLTRRSDLLAVTVSPPLVFLAACVCAQAVISADGTSAAEGTLMNLAGSAPWLFAGTVVTVLIALCRGLAANVREHRMALRGDPARRPDGPGRSARTGHGPE